MEELGPKTQALREELQKLQLGYVRAKYWGGRWHDAYMRIMDMIIHKGEGKGPSIVRWVAGGIFSEWLTSEISSDKFIEDDCTNRVEEAGRLNLAIHKITQAAKSAYPPALFDAAASTRVAAMLKFSKRQTRELEHHLHDLVHKASFRIETAFPSDESTDMYGYQYYPESNYTAGRAHYDAHHGGYFTCMKIPDELPWDTQDHALAGSARSIALLNGINVADVTPGWLQALEKHYAISE